MIRLNEIKTAYKVVKARPKKVRVCSVVKHRNELFSVCLSNLLSVYVSCNVPLCGEGGASRNLPLCREGGASRNLPSVERVELPFPSVGRVEPL